MFKFILKILAGFGFILVIILSAVYMDSRASVDDTSKQLSIDEMMLPEGSTLLEVVKTNKKQIMVKYVIFEFRGQCFIQRSDTHSGFLSTINCPQR